MVLSGAKKTTYMSSIKNQPTGGGSKKCGLVPTACERASVFVCYNDNGLPIPLRNARTNRFFRFPNQNLPVGFNPLIQMH